MKAHSAHPGTAELVARAILAAIDICQIDKGVFSLIQGENYAIASQIIMHPLIKAVGFTGSERVGMILQAQIHQRSEPIPFYGELGSLNPQFILTNKLAQNTDEIAQGLVASLAMSHGQLCTSPGIWIVQKGKGYQNFIISASQALSDLNADVMLTPGIASTYKTAVEEWNSIDGVELLAQAKAGQDYECQSALFCTDLATFINNSSLREEVFGACALIVTCEDEAEMMQLITLLKGNLSASIHALDSDLMQAKSIANVLAHKVGRLIYNQMPTGVEVCASMNHGGPFPASTNIRTTSVGTAAIKRFQRPICYQNMPAELLPALLK